MSAMAPSPSATALLLFSFGPVQGFIAAGRRTADLWAGSTLLAWLAEEALRPVRERLGDDAVLFPDLSGAAGDPGRASLPNRFLALVPEAEAAQLAAAAEKALGDALKRAAAHAINRVNESSESKGGFSPIDVSETREDVARYAEVYWASLPIPPDDAAARALAHALYSDAPEAEAGTSVLERHYGLLYRAVEGMTGARKALRDFGGGVENGYRCTLMPERPALLAGLNDRPGAVRDAWNVVASASRGRIRMGERLSAVALTKRFFPEYAQHVLKRDVDPAFPSTSSFAAADFVQAVLQRAAHDEGLRADVEAYVRAAGKVNAGGRFTEAILPGLVEAADRVAGNAGALARLSGRLLLGDDLDAEEIKRETGETVTQGDLDALAGARRALLSAAGRTRRIGDDPDGIALPSRYYAVLVLDGDHMGRWLSGAKGFAPDDPRTAASGPERHRTISHSLNGFALDAAPREVEQRALGRLVYGGGDDVFAFLSFETALPAARALRRAFADEGLGVNATASAGLVLAHHLTPLGQVLASAREAEQGAKKAGRDRLTVTALKRSGAPVQTVLPWGALDPLTRYAELIRNGGVSTGLVFDLAELVRRLADARGEAWPGLADAFRSESARLFSRRVERIAGEDARRLAFDETIGAALDRALADADEELTRVREKAAEETWPAERLREAEGAVSRRPYEDVIALLQVAQFLGRGGDR